MITKVMNKSFLWCFVFISWPIIAQDHISGQNQFINEIIESLSENADEDADYSNIFNELTELSEHPLNLNSANDDELEKLVMLSSFQIASIIDYRAKVGTIRSVYELSYLPGFREKDIQMLEQYTICEEPKPTPISKKALFKYTKNQLLIRYQRVIEKQTGYEKVTDSILVANPNKSHYLGSPDKLFYRYGFSAGDNIHAGVVMEKDAGEEFFAGGNTKGFDFYSAHLLYSDEKRLLRTIALGDYHVQLGQGLLMWSSYSGFKTSYVGQLAKRPATVKRSFSTEENRFLRGAAVTLGKSDFTLTFFGSHNKIDASIINDSSGSECFTGFAITGNHNTPLEILKEDQLPVNIFGISARYDANRLKIGLNGVYTEYGILPDKSEKLYKSYSFYSHNIKGLSADYRYLGLKSQLFGEVAYSNNSLAIINGLLFHVNNSINLGAIHRHYHPGYYSHFSGAFGEGSEIANENGFYLGTEINIENMSVRAYGDIFSFPWLKYQVNAPSEGSEVFVELGYPLGLTNWYFRYKRQEKPKNYSNNENKLTEVLPFQNQQYRLNTVYPVGGLFTLQSRIELSMAGFTDSINNTGYCLIQDFTLSKLAIPLHVTLRAAYFNISDYNARIYSYEKDVLYAYSSTMFYGKGWRFACLVKWQPNQWVSFYLKYALFLYPGEETIGSGLNAINSNHKSEIKSEVIFRF